MNAARDRIWLALAILVQAASFAAVASAARQGAAPSTIVLGLAASFVPYSFVLLYSRALNDTRSADLLVTAAAAILGTIWLSAPPSLSDDLYRYLWEGKLWLQGLNPYRLPPDDPSLESLRDSLWHAINNKPLASIYPPLSQLLFAAAAMLGGGVLGVQALGLAGLVASVGWTAKWTGNSRVALAIGLNPLVSSESVLDGHLDVLVGAALLTVAYALSRQRFVQAAFAVCIASGLKVVGVVALPFLWRRPKVLAGAAGFTALLLLPLAAYRTLGDPTSGPGQFVTRWQGNESLFALFDWLGNALFSGSVASLAPRVASAIALIGIVAVVLARGGPPTGALRIVLWTVLLLSPQVHPWYLAWLLPLDLACGGRAALVWSAAVLCAYVPLDRWVSEGVWQMPLGLQIMEYAAVGVALVVDFRSNSKLLS